MINIQHKKQIRGLMQDPRWPALEAVFENYLKENFLEGDAKRANEFETLWAVAFQDGAKYHLKAFFNSLESMAMNIND